MLPNPASLFFPFYRILLSSVLFLLSSDFLLENALLSAWIIIRPAGAEHALPPFGELFALSGAPISLYLATLLTGSPQHSMADVDFRTLSPERMRAYLCDHPSTIWQVSRISVA